MDPRNWLYDKRIARRNIDKELMSREQYDNYIRDLKSLSEEDYEFIDITGKDSEAQGENAEGEESAESNPEGTFPGVLP